MIKQDNWRDRMKQPLIPHQRLRKAFEQGNNKIRFIFVTNIARTYNTTL